MTSNGSGNGRDHEEEGGGAPPSDPATGYPLLGTDAYLDPDYIHEDIRRRYRDSDFHVTIKNGFDHAIPRKIQIHPVMYNAMTEMVRSRCFPIASEDDLMRVGTIEYLRKLYYLRSNGNVVSPNWMIVLEAVSKDEVETEQMRQFEESFQKLLRDVKWLVSLGEFGEGKAAGRIIEYKKAVKKLESGWREWWLERVEKEFGELVVRQERRVKLRRGGDE